MEKLRPRLLRTYLGPGSRRGCGLRRQPWPSEPWISPQVDPRQLFSTSSSASGGGSPASFSAASSLSEDPDFLPFKKQQLRPRRKAKARPRRGAKQNKASQGGREADTHPHQEGTARGALHQGGEERAPQEGDEAERAPQQKGEEDGASKEGGEIDRGPQLRGTAKGTPHKRGEENRSPKEGGHAEGGPHQEGTAKGTLQQGGEETRASREGDKAKRAPNQEGEEEGASWKGKTPHLKGKGYRSKKNRAPHRRGKENSAPQQRDKASRGSTTSNSSTQRSSFVPPTPLRRNITLRTKHQGPLWNNWGESSAHTRVWLRGQPPLLSSTPELCRLRPTCRKHLVEEDETSLLQSSGSVAYSSTRCPQLDSKENGYLPEDVLIELSLLSMDEEPNVQKTGDSVSREGFRRFVSVGETPLRQSPSMQVSQRHLSQSHHTPLQSHSALLSHNALKETEASAEWESLTTSPENHSFVPHQLLYHHLQADKDCLLPSSPEGTSSSAPRGALQLQARMFNGKIALSLPKDATPFTNIRRQRITVQASPTLEKKETDLNGTLSGEGSEGSIDQSSPHFQPVVVLESQVVPDWLASQATKKQAMDCFSEKESTDNLQPDSNCPLPTITRSNNEVVPTYGTTRKACISGFSSNRWVRQGKLGQVKRKKNMGKKQRPDTSFFQTHLKWNELENDNVLSLLSPDCPLLKNSTWWRRIRASFSLHKKKKILSEAEGFDYSTSSQSPPPQTPKTPFTQKLGYSICPASSMVLLSAMKFSSTPEITLTDKEKVYGECQQEGPISFEECIPPEKMQKCEKIGEGVFGEVFKTYGERGTVALKIIPIEGSDRVNGEPQKTFCEILPEIIISKELSLLAEGKDNQTFGFISLYSVHCVQGAYPKCLLKAWDEYDRLRNSENDRPDFFGKEQLFMILEFEFGGTDLENMRDKQLNSVVVAKSILFQVTASLAVAEEALHFEHRDLHWGNILVKKTHLKELSFMLNGETHSVSTQGILVNVIDYTFSRLEKDGLTVYCDLSTDEEVFQGRGDYQFDIYRQMRIENGNSWADYLPHSNILWLHYLADKLLKAVTYKKKPVTPSMKQVQKQLKLFSDEVLGFRSARDLLCKSTFFH